MEFIDSHCHLQFDAYRENESGVMSRATQVGVKRFICVGTSLGDSEEAAALAARHKNVWASAGAHPHDATKFLQDKNSAKKLKEIASGNRVVAIGETGLDYYKQYSSKPEQEKVLRTHLETALELDLPLIFHVREAFSGFWPIFDSYTGLRGVVHSFSSSRSDLGEILSRGLYIGLNGIMTFTQDQEQLEAANSVPSDKLLLETDAPFLTPAPMRTELCEPRHLAVTAQFLAKLRGQDLADLATVATANSLKLFGLEN